MKKLISTLLALTFVLTLPSCAGKPEPHEAPEPESPSEPSSEPASNSETQAKYRYLTLPGWEENVKKGINSMFDMLGKYSEGYDSACPPYTIFDFDNTVAILDVGEILAIYQLEHLRFAIEPEQMFELLTSPIPAKYLEGTDTLREGYGGLPLADVARDAADAYKKLWEAGYVATDSSREALMPEWIATDEWKEFSSKMRWLYDAIGGEAEPAIAHVWTNYWFTGMTPEQVYLLATESHEYYLNGDGAALPQIRSFTGPSAEDYKSLTGPVTASYKYPLAITDEIKELWACLEENGFDTWVCSGSYIDVLEAAALQPDKFGLIGCDGVLGTRNKTDASGRYIAECDYDPYPCTLGVGKSESISKVAMPQYRGHGPSFTVGDSRGDFNFMTEYHDTVLSLLLNMPHADAGGLCAAAAVYQKNSGTDLAAAVENGDTLYLLQGLDENKAVFLPQRESFLLGKQEAVLLDDTTKLADGNTVASLSKDIGSGKTYPSLADMFNSSVGIVPALEEYIGYKTR